MGTKYAFVYLLCITENANDPSHFPDIRLHVFVCGVLSVATLLSYVGYAYVKIIKQLVTYLLFMVQIVIKI